MVKVAAKRPRPFWTDTRIGTTSCNNGYSMPAGHVVVLVTGLGAVCIMLWRRRRAKPPAHLLHVRSSVLLVVITAIIVAMALSEVYQRAYDGAHYLHDGLAGLAVGLASLAAVDAAYVTWARDPTGTVLRWASVRGVLAIAGATAAVTVVCMIPVMGGFPTDNTEWLAIATVSPRQTLTCPLHSDEFPHSDADRRDHLPRAAATAAGVVRGFFMAGSLLIGVLLQHRYGLAYNAGVNPGVPVFTRWVLRPAILLVPSLAVAGIVSVLMPADQRDVVYLLAAGCLAVVPALLWITFGGPAAAVAITRRWGQRYRCMRLVDRPQEAADTASVVASTPRAEPPPEGAAAAEPAVVV